MFRSHKHLACQLIDDSAGNTLVAASKKLSYGGNCEAAEVIGKVLGERANKAGINRARFDRGPARYLGRVAALADAAREGGLQL